MPAVICSTKTRAKKSAIPTHAPGAEGTVHERGRFLLAHPVVTPPPPHRNPEHAPLAGALNTAGPSPTPLLTTSWCRFTWMLRGEKSEAAGLLVEEAPENNLSTPLSHRFATCLSAAGQKQSADPRDQIKGI